MNYPGIDHLVNDDEVAAAREILQEPTPGKEASSWAKLRPCARPVAELVNDGDSVALEGFTHLIPTAAGHEIIRQERRNLTLIRMTPDLIHDQMIVMGCGRKLIFSFAAMARSIRQHRHGGEKWEQYTCTSS